ncbi:apicoplast RNA methyltransferase precursor, putative [Plasmodium sp. DRC-Itaito]|nr:apicoplast RNA methyltransferase precursor, putative [Plasmodium sp. DRC-Itaito]
MNKKCSNKYIIIILLFSFIINRYTSVNIYNNEYKIKNNKCFLHAYTHNYNDKRNSYLYTHNSRYNSSINTRRNNFLDKQNDNITDYVYGLNSVYAVLKKNERKIEEVIVNMNIKLNRKIHKQNYEYIFDELKKRNVSIRYMEKYRMNELVGGFPHNDIIMKTNYRYMNNYKDFIKNIKHLPNKNNIFICLHDLYDNMNIGNVCRSIFFFGGHTIFLKKKKKVNEKKNNVKIDTPILHSSVGSSEFLNFYHINNMANFMSQMKLNGFTIYATSCYKNNASCFKYINLNNIKIKENEKILIILGNESKGLKDDILQNSDYCVYINNLCYNENNQFHIDSLNVNNVCSIMLYHFYSNMIK